MYCLWLLIFLHYNYIVFKMLKKTLTNEMISFSMRQHLIIAHLLLLSAPFSV